MSKHTPGPWVAMQGGRYVTENPWSVDHEDGNDNTIAPVGGPDGQVIALVVMDDENRENRWDDSELDANASLIAAAPDLLESVEKALMWIDIHSFHGTNTVALMNEFRYVIAKARGES